MAEFLPGPSSLPSSSALPETSEGEKSSKDEEPPQLLCISFVRNADRIAAGGDYGATIYKTHENDTPFVLYETTKKPREKEYTSLVNDVCVLECFSSTYKLAMVFGTSPRTLFFYDAISCRGTGSSHFSERILSVKSCSTLVVVGLETEIQCFSIYEYSFSNLKKYSRLLKLPCPLNFSSLLDVGGEERPYLAYPDSATTGIVAYHDACSHTHTKRFINAHNHPIGALRFNNNATMLATTSNVGTIIRIYAVLKNECLFVFRRGMARSVRIQSMAFSMDSRFLCVSSNTETIHVFKLEGELPKFLHREQELIERYKEQSEPPKKIGFYDYVAQTSQAAMDYLAPQRDFAYAILPESANLKIAALRKFDEELHIYVALSTRKFFSFLVRPEGGIAELRNNGGRLVSNVTKHFDDKNA